MTAPTGPGGSVEGSQKRKSAMSHGATSPSPHPAPQPPLPPLTPHSPWSILALTFNSDHISLEGHGHPPPITMGSIQSSSGAYFGTCRRQSARPGAVFVSAPRCLIPAPPINPNVLFTGQGRRPALGATRAALISPRVMRAGSDGFAKSFFFTPPFCISPDVSPSSGSRQWNCMYRHACRSLLMLI